MYKDHKHKILKGYEVSNSSLRLFSHSRVFVSLLKSIVICASGIMKLLAITDYNHELMARQTYEQTRII